ncbi:unnamed protein product [Rotaria magnacalcarata]|uniref:Uncharacterized protein n=1 Tax=Rotaria magnacalcarata TaxID=392030 RepID=A0A8S3HN71_9BILA|nr:unnamed protein product [Rotaria magnacalcarata]
MPKRTSKEAFSWELVEKQCRETHRPGYELGGEASRPGYELGGETSRPGYELGGKASRPGCELGSDQASNALNDARHRLTIQQEELVSKRTQLSNVQLQQYFKNIQQSILQTQLSKMRTNYAAISSLLNQFRNVKVHLTNVLDSSKTLTVELKSLIDFELVIVPLKTLAEQMIKDQLMQSFNFEITVNTIVAVDRVLDQLSEKLERFPLLHQNSAML